MTTTMTMTSAPAGSLSWRPASVAVMRLAGFPFHWLTRLRDEAVTDAAAERLAADAALDELAGRAGDPLLRQSAGNTADRHILRAMHRRRAYTPRPEAPTPRFQTLLEQFETALRRRADAEQELERVYAESCDRTGQKVIDRFRNTPELRDMLLVSNDQAYPRLIGWLDDPELGRRPARKNDRNNIATLVRYLQRVCAKNDTTSHFGPLATARVTTGDTGVSWVPAGLERHTRLARWAAEAVARTIFGDPLLREHLCPRPVPGARVNEGRLRVLSIDQGRRSTDARTALRVDPPIDLTPHQAAVFELCDGATSVRRMSDLLTGDPWPALRHLADAGAVHLEAELPYGADDSLAGVREMLAGVDPGHPAHAICAGLVAAVHNLQEAPPPGRPEALARLKAEFTRATGLPAAHGGSGFYSDRSVFHEHCVCTPRELTIGRPLSDRMSGDLALLYDMFLLRPRWRLKLERDLLAGWFTRRFGAGRAVPVPDYVAAYLDDLGELAEGYQRIDDTVAEMGDALEAALLPAATDDRRVHVVQRATVRRLVERYGLNEPAVCNPDLMIAARSAQDLAGGRFRLVVGDLHAMEDHLSHGSVAPFVGSAFPEYRAEALRHYAGLLAPGEQLADVTQHHRNKTYPRLDLECRDVEAFDRSGRPPAERLRLADLDVCHDGERLRLRPPTGPALRLIAPPHAWPMLGRNPFSVFGFPTDTAGAAVHGTGRRHIPRIQVGDVVLRRESWRIDAGAVAAASVAEEPEAFARVQGLRARLGLPRHLYLRCSGEPKPVYCDLDSPLLVRQVTRTAAGLPPEEPLTFGEMLPGPDELWLDDGAGGRTAEIRYAVFTTPDSGQRG
ncbi:lantibiotic dehydratase [Actinoplanes oblitus]|uniref:Lantibiotic dehydratase n=1 Tax=Actinoplanes oblitus TaxID=3040509 RepID=A0ABY8WAX1_9ACTN|nr:lantibiotic dehydratase [Actinoplanes oblitus]WIM94517.1 lantibiotic dehydratase [Actinoplanes oblitus]